MQKRAVFLLFAAAALTLMLSTTASFAVDIPSTAEPARVQQQIPEPPALKPPEQPVKAEPPEPATAPEGAEKIQFTLEAITIESMTAYSTADVAPLYQSMIGKTISFVEIYNLAEKLTAKYRNEGYILSQVIVPPQEIENGRVTLQAVEGFVDQVNIQNEKPGENAYLKAIGDKIKATRPMNIKTLERTLLLLNDLPGISAKSILSPSPKTPGASDLTLVIGHKPYNFSAGADNRGSRFMGALQLNTNLRLNNPFGAFEGLNLQMVTAPENFSHREMDYVSFGMTRPIGHEGTTLSVSGSLTSTDPGYTLKPLGVSGMAHAYNIEVTHPFLRSRSDNLFVTLKFNYLDSTRSDNLLAGKIEDRLRVLRLGASYQFADSGGGSNTLAAELSQGLDIFNMRARGSPNMTRLNGNPEFFKATAEAAHIHRLMNKLDLSASVSGQWSASTLLASEEFGVGGSNYGSAYDNSEITGKNGLAARLELRANNPVATPLQVFQLYGFYDIGQVWDPRNAALRDRIRALASTGIGVRGVLSELISGSLEIAFPLTRRVAAVQSQDPRVFWSVTAKF